MSNVLDRPGSTKRIGFDNSAEYTDPVFVPNTDPTQVKWGVGTMPAKFDQYPGQDPAEKPALARSFFASTMGDNSSALVMVFYASSDKRHAGNPPPEPVPLSQFALIPQITYRETTVDVPFVTIVEETQPIAGTTSQQLVSRRWVWTVDQIIESRTVLRARWRITNPGMDDVNAFADQQNRLHMLPGGKLWRFTASEMVSVSQTEYEVHARWEYDAGTPLMQAFPIVLWKDPMLPGDMAYLPGHAPGQDLTRDPYKELGIQQDQQIVITGTPSSPLNPEFPNEPLMSQKVRFVDNPSLHGTWADLPGFPGF